MDATQAGAGAAEDDALEWGYGPLAAAQQAHSVGVSAVAPEGPADPSSGAMPRTATEHHGALARAAAVRAAGGRRRQMQRRRKENKTGFKASELLSRADQLKELEAGHDDRDRSAGTDEESQEAARQACGTGRTARRAGARTGGNGGGSGGSGQRSAAPPPAQGFAALTEEQLVSPSLPP